MIPFTKTAETNKPKNRLHNMKEFCIAKGLGLKISLYTLHKVRKYSYFSHQRTNFQVMCCAYKAQQ